MTMAEKILAAHAGLDEVEPGQLIECDLDLVLANDITAPIAIKTVREITDKVFDPTKIALVPDHYTPNKDIKSAEQAKIVRDFVREQGITHYYEVGCMGVEHALLPEQGVVGAGDLIIGADSHTCTYGALGAFSTGVGSTDAGVGMATGKAWFKVPETIKFVINGELAPGVTGKDVILHIIGMIGVDGALYKAMEFTGSAIENMPMDERLSISNMAIEAGGKAGLIPVDDVTRAYLDERAERPYTAYYSDDDAQFAQVIEIDAADIVPTVAFPHLPSNTRPVAEARDVKIDQAVIGSCTNGRLEDMRQAADVLRGRKVHPDVRCIVIPAIKKNAVIPDQLVKRLAGVTLIQRAIDTARGVVPAHDVVVVTDSQEISLICERNGVRVHYNAGLRFTSLDIITEMKSILRELGNDYGHIIIYRASCPLLTWVDIDDAYKTFLEDEADCLVTVKSVRHRIWEVHQGRLESFMSEDESELVVESKALIIVKSDALDGGTIRHTVPYFLNDRAMEINSYQDWWLCERLLTQRRVVFVVAGYPAIGMGHVFRSLMLAHEIANHKVFFVCTKESELAASNIAARDYKTVIQQGELWEDVLALDPDLVINDMLDTPREYMEHLKAANIPVVNFEDEGPGSVLADQVVNALYEEPQNETNGKQPERFLYGHKYFCLRDEFLQAEQNAFRPDPKCILITFGGTDMPDYTRQTLDTVEPLCRERGIAIRVVTGPGYAHRDELVRHIKTLGNPLLRFEYATNIMSRMMEGVDLAICSAGRTVYELAHMHIPSIVLAQHEREARHTFARADHGFAYMGIMRKFNAGRLRKVFVELIDEPERRNVLYQRQSRIHFEKNKAKVVSGILKLLKKEKES